MIDQAASVPAARRSSPTPMIVEQPTTLLHSPRVAHGARAGASVATEALAHRRIFAWWLGSRALVLLSAAIMQIAHVPAHQPSFLRHPFALLGSWDSRWYEIVAHRGYLFIPHGFSDPAFFPLFPVIERLGAAIGLPYVVTGALVANLGFLVGLLALYELGRELLPESDARRAAIYLAVFPMSFVFSLAYPEGLVLPLIALAAVCALRDRWLAAACFAGAAALARPEGLFIVFPLAAIAVRRWPTAGESIRARAVAAVIAPVATLATFSAYLGWTLGDPLAWSKAERAWGRSFSVHGLHHAFAQLLAAPKDHNEWIFRDVAFCGIYVLLLVVALLGGVPRSWIVAAVATVLFPIASGSFTSDARFGLLAPAVFWGLAIAGRRRLVNRVVLAVCPLLLIAAVFTLPLRWP